MGVKGSKGEVVIGTVDGAWRTRTVRRRPEEVRWSSDEVEQTNEVPWDKKNEKDEVARPREGVERVAVEMQAEEKRAVAQGLSMPKSFHMHRDDYERHGYTRGCPGCRALLTGTSRQQHTTQCRSRREKDMGDNDRAKAAKRRREDFLEKVIASAGQGGGVGAEVGGDVQRRSEDEEGEIERPAAADWIPAIENAAIEKRAKAKPRGSLRCTTPMGATPHRPIRRKRRGIRVRTRPRSGWTWTTPRSGSAR